MSPFCLSLSCYQLWRFPSLPRSQKTVIFFAHRSSYMPHSPCAEAMILFKTLLKTSLPFAAYMCSLQEISHPLIARTEYHEADILGVFLYYTYRIRLSDSVEAQSSVLCNHSIVIIHLITVFIFHLVLRFLQLVLNSILNSLGRRRYLPIVVV